MKIILKLWLFKSLYSITYLQCGWWGQTKNFEFEKLKNKGSVTGWFCVLGDGTKLPPVRIEGALIAETYLRYFKKQSTLEIGVSVLCILFIHRDILIPVVLPFLAQRHDRNNIIFMQGWNRNEGWKIFLLSISFIILNVLDFSPENWTSSCF